MRRWFLIGALLLLATQPTTADPAPYTLDMLLPMTGSSAFFGEAENQAAQIYEKVVNSSGGIHGRPLRFEVHDDASNPIVDVQLVNGLLPKRPVAILGPSVTATCSAIAPLFARGPVNYCFSPGILPNPGGYVFSASAPLRSTFRAAFTKARQFGYHRMGVLISMDASGQVHDEVASQQLASPEKTFAVVSIEKYNPSDISCAAQVARMKATNPDIVYVSAIGPAFQTALRELRNSGVDVPILTTPANANPTELKQYASVLPTTLLIDGMPYEGKLPKGSLKAAADEFLTAFKAAGVRPTAAHAYAWDPIRIVISALRTLPADATAAQLHDYLENLHDFGGLWGYYDFRSGDQHGVSGAELPWIRWDTQAATWVYFDGRPGK